MFWGMMEALGGLGLFLLGMAVMTGGLRELAGGRLRTFLANSTRSPMTGVATGAACTAIIQSSSATTVAAVGFVDAGLLQFSGALGIIFGANIGTTITGWIIALLGFKLKLGSVVMPVILLGMLMRLTGKPVLSNTGMALAGFGLIFVGIDSLQSGMAVYQGVITPDTFPSDTIGGRLLLVLLGIVITIITQSSSAGVAAALTAVHTGTINVSQAAAMVIGMDVGTTFTALIATIGGGVQSRRTGAAHVVYNVLTATMAFVLLTPYLNVTSMIQSGGTPLDPEVVIVAFHSMFNLLGVVAILPFTNAFASLLIRLIPERGDRFTRRLDDSIISTPGVALTAVTATVNDLVITLFNELSSKLSQGSDPVRDAGVSEAITATHEYVLRLNQQGQDAETTDRCMSFIHVLDHLRRLDKRLTDESRTKLACSTSDLNEARSLLSGTVERFRGPTVSQVVVEEFESMNAVSKHTAKRFRKGVIHSAANGQVDAVKAMRLLDAARWIRRVAYHTWRITHHMRQAEGKPSSGKP